MRSPFDFVSQSNPGRSMFDLSYRKKFTADMGLLYPIFCEEAVPGDRFKLGMDMVIRFNPTIFPIVDPIWATVHFFFVPTRILWEDWETFITGGVSGTDATALPRWVPSVAEYAEGTLWDMLGYPTGVAPAGLSAPIDFGKRAYNKVWNDYYRDETLQTEVALTDANLLYRNWRKDYFTSALPNQQRGIAPALPISGKVPIFTDLASATSLVQQVGAASAPTANVQTYGSGLTIYPAKADLSGASTFNVNDIRLVFAVQRWQERNSRAGVRYTEFLGSHFGVSPRDERLQRPEYIGGSRQPVIVSEVLQTSRSDTGQTPQGTMAGHAITAGRGMIGTYRVEEYGFVIGMLSIMPEPSYQQGFDRQWLKRTRYDYYFPEFANLSEQAIELEELYAQASETTNRSTFGYQGRFDELRVKRSMTCGKMRSSLKAWGLTRIFASAPALNSAFISSADIRKDIFAVPSEPGLIVNYGNVVHCLRPLPYQSEPGLIDHG